MHHEGPLRVGSYRHIDTNSLLRMYDVTRRLSTTGSIIQERVRSIRAMTRITAELRRRKISYDV